MAKTVASVIKLFTKAQKQLEQVVAKCETDISFFQAAIDHAEYKRNEVKVEKEHAERIAKKLEELLA